MTALHGSIWRFTGDPDRLAAAYDAFLSEVGTDNLLVHLCLLAPDGLIVVDTCPDRDAWERFDAGRAGFVAAMARHGLPEPSIQDFPVHAVQARLPVAS
ncbi:MAG: hypothetical protein U0Y82_02560 [Thermoleophilia bacterium]